MGQIVGQIQAAQALSGSARRPPARTPAVLHALFVIGTAVADAKRADAQLPQTDC